MFRFVPLQLALVLVGTATALAQQAPPNPHSESLSDPNAQVPTSGVVAPTVEMWFYEQENRRHDDNDSHEFKGEQIVFLDGKADLKNPRTGQLAHARFLGAARPFKPHGEDELRALADWVASPDNPYFARVQANRVWFPSFCAAYWSTETPA